MPSTMSRSASDSAVSATSLRPAVPRGCPVDHPDHAVGLPVLPALPLCTCCRHYPGAATGIAFALSPSRISLPQYGSRVGPRIVLFEACSAFTRVTACTLALSPYVVTRFTRGFNDFVTSIVAPVASGWSSCRVGLAPTGKAPPFHGARQERTFSYPLMPRPPRPRSSSLSDSGSDPKVLGEGSARTIE